MEEEAVVGKSPLSTTLSPLRALSHLAVASRVTHLLSFTLACESRTVRSPEPGGDFSCRALKILGPASLSL